MKRYRSALMAGLLALAVAVCDDDGTVVQPPPTVNVSPPQVTVTVPPAPPVVAPLQAMITPPSAEVGVDGMVDFAVGTTGGSGDASWTCTSSDVAVATVETTDTGCRATAVAGGGATITAAVTKGSESTNVAANLTVSTTADAFVLVTSVKGAGDTDATELKGRVDVMISVERGNQTFERLSLNVDGMEVAAQDFGTAAADDAEQTVHTFTLSFDSDGYEEHGDHVDVDYMNGEHSIQATLKIAGRDEALMSNVMAVEFKNPDFLKASLSGLGEGATNETTGQMWYGGPDASVEVSAMPVVFSSGDVSSVTLEVFCGADAMTDSEAPFVFPLKCKGVTDGMAPTFTVGGKKIDAKGGKVYLDFEAPTAPHFNVDPNKRENGWVNADVDFLGGYDPDKEDTKDSWLVYDKTGSTEGVGGYMPQLYVAPAGSDKKVGGALATTALTEVPAAALAALAGQSSKMDAYCVVVSAVDRLGNESKLPKADADCVAAGVYNTATSAGLLAGIDVQAPTISFSAASPSLPKSAPRLSATQEFQLQVSDPGSNASGIRSPNNEPVNVEASRRNATKTTEIEIEAADLGVSLPLVTTDIVSADNQAYYTVKAETFDKAGNRSEKIMRTAVLDTEAPVTGTIIGTYDKKKGLYPVTATVTDNLSIKAYWAEMRFAGSPGNLSIANNLFLPQEGGTAVDAFNAPALSTEALAPIMVRTYQAIQTAENITNLASIGVFARDHGDNTSVGALTTGRNEGNTAGAFVFNPALNLTIAEDGFNLTATVIDVAEDADAAAVTTALAALEPSAYKVFQTLVATAKVKSGTVTLTATATGDQFKAPVAATTGNSDAQDGAHGLRDNPLTRVDFYAAVDTDGGNGREALKYIGSVDGATAGAEDGDFDEETANMERRFIYSLEISAPVFLEIVGGEGDYGVDDENTSVDATDGAIIAIGVREDDQAVGFSSSAVELTVKD